MKKYGHISIYFFSYFLNAAISFGVLSFLTHYLSTKDYGIINLYSSFIIFLSPLISGGILQTVNVEFFKKKKDEYAPYLTNALVIPLISTAVFTLLAFLFTASLTDLLKVNSLFVWLLPVTSLFIVFNELVFMITRNLNRPWLYAIFSIGKNILEATLSLLLVVGFHKAVNGRIDALILAAAFFAVIIYFILKRWGYIATLTKLDKVKAIFLISAPLISERMSFFFISSSDRYFIDHFVSTSEVGLYSVGAQIAAITNLTLLSMNNFFYPHIFRQISYKEAGGKSSIRKAVFSYSLMSLVAVLGVLVATPLIFKWFIGPSFQKGQFYAFLLTCAYLPWTIYQSLLPILLYHQQNRFIMYISILAIVFTLAFNFFLIPIMGAKGAAITLLAVNTILALIVFFKVRNKYSFLFYK